MYTFLTDEWMEAARGLREQYTDRLPDVDIEVRIIQIVTDIITIEQHHHRRRRRHHTSSSSTIVIEAWRLGVLAYLKPEDLDT